MALETKQYLTYQYFYSPRYDLVFTGLARLEPTGQGPCVPVHQRGRLSVQTGLVGDWHSVVVQVHPSLIVDQVLECR
jgi:hypothetical protein